MPTYVYETVTADGKPSPASERFEVSQSIHDAPLTKHPETGKPVRRVIQGFSILGSPSNESTARPKGACGPGCGCHH